MKSHRLRRPRHAFIGIVPRVGHWITVLRQPRPCNGELAFAANRTGSDANATIVNLLSDEEKVRRTPVRRYGAFARPWTASATT